jgi:YbgC/YbaW family acyl-CoA thioester hydrolase
MPSFYERTFRVRYYECDAYGHVNNTHYLRYVQETALDAATMMGYDAAQAAALNYHWQLREVDIAYARPLKYGDAVTVKTQVEACDASRVRHRYTFQIAPTGDEAARARTDVELRDNVTHQPAPIPAHWAAVFAADNIRQPEPFPPESAPPQRIFTLQRRVMWQDVDASHQLHPATLLDYVEACGNAVLLAHGWPIGRMMQDGFAIIMRRMRVAFVQPIRLDDELTISTWASEFKRISAVRYYLFTRASDNTLVARAHALGVWLNTTTMQPIRLPPHFLADFATNIVI